MSQPISHEPRPSEVTADLLRRLTVTASAIVCLGGSAAGVGVFGGPPIAAAAGGIFRPDATLLTPGSGAFAIWSLIYTGLLAYTLHQWLPGQARSRRHRAVGWLVAASMLLNAGWIAAAQADLLSLTLVVMLTLTVVLSLTVHELNLIPQSGPLERWMVDGPLGLYLGWTLMATVSNTGAWLTGHEIDLFSWGSEPWAMIGLLLLTVGGCAPVMAGRGRFAVAAALLWGLGWLIQERLFGQMASGPVAVAAGLAGLGVLICFASRRHTVLHEERLAARAAWVQEGSAPAPRPES